MHRRMTLQLARLRSNRRGSTLVLTLIFAGILALAIGTMLMNVSQLARSTDDKIAYEEAYHVGMGGVQMTKAWLMDPALARAQLTQNSFGDKMTAITSGSILLTSETVYQRNEGNADWAITRTPDQIAAIYAEADSSLGTGETIEGGARKVLYTFTGDLLRFQGDADTESTASGELRTASGSIRSRVTKIRVTTPYCTTGGNDAGVTPAGTWTRDSLLRTSLIVDAEAETFSQGVKKTRWVQQKLLIAPTITTDATSVTEIIEGVSDAPPVSPGGVIVSGGSIPVQGNSHMNVWWGPVLVKGNINVVQMDQISLDTAAKQIVFDTTGNGSKFFAAGVDNSSDGNIGLEKWLKWQAGPSSYDSSGNPTSSDGLILDAQDDEPIFATSVNLGQPAGTYIDDIFNRYKNYEIFGLSYANGGLSPNGNDPSTEDGQGWTINLSGAYANGATTMPFDSATTGVYFTNTPAGSPYTLGNGAFVQQSVSVSQIVDRTINQDMNYASWKQYAISKNGYAKPGLGGYVDANNRPLWVTSDRRLIASNTQPSGTLRFESLRQVSMINLIPAGERRSTFNIADQILFIDTAEGNPVGVANSGTPGATNSAGVPINVSLNSADDFFWKGLLYINGNLSTTGGGSFPTIWGQNPEQYEADPGGTTLGHQLVNCYMDGVLFVAGEVSRTGNASIYGTMVSMGGTSGGGPNLYYNSRNRGGLFQEPPQIIITEGEVTVIDPDNKRTISGPIRELNAWPASDPST